MAYSSHGLHKMQISHISIYFGHICTNFISLSHSCQLAITDARSCDKRWLSLYQLCHYAPYKYPGGGGGTLHMKGVGMLIGNFELQCTVVNLLIFFT